MPEALPDELHTAVSLGLLLLASLAAGILADLIRIPKVSAYLLAGMLVGPSVAHWIGDEQLHHLAPLTKLAMALVLLELGYQFSFVQIRRIMRHAVWLSSGELLVTFVLVCVTTYAISQSVPIAVLLAALALATAPATTVLVLKESRSEGPVTELAEVLVALNNIVAIVAFEVLFLVAFIASGLLDQSITSELMRLAADLGGACLLGLAAGLVISYGSGLLSRRRWLVMIFAVVVLTLGLCESWQMPYMLAFLVAGMVVVNTSDVTGDLLGEQEKIGGLLIVVFFAVHGAELELAAFLTAGLLGTGYIVARSAGKILGIRWAAQLRKEAPPVRRFLGSCMLAQAGAAIALASLAQQRWPEIGNQLQDIILGSVVFFEIVGPIFLRWSVLQAGEVPLAQAISHRTETPTSQAGKMWHRGRDALGLKPKQSINLQAMTVGALVRKNVKGLQQSAHFDEVVAYIQHSHDNTYIVVDDHQQVAGVIRYNELSDTFFDSAIDILVYAEDLTSPTAAVLNPEQSLAEAIESFRIANDDVLPVVDAQTHQLIGIVRRGDVTELAIRLRPKESGEKSDG